uniref:Leucine-rich repeat-containing N-terminal plant-type domain-containing protein n=1 Tax=Amphora coffeiformis TaxID=265554 RepID=A0A7S3P6C9_9STRA|mmetsp:Transcript_6416/g.12838  ORF Transcript_6416/g.12838 Transcript_6416/m.12838 type:complete len:381 (+) Transcript_6416:114-1256(+)|eukprot:scaffold3077_cov162-Amphora_coffeaeformis.AAC.11
MTFTEDTVPSGVDPLASAESEESSNIERVEHAPEENNKGASKSAEDDDDGRIYLWLSCLVGVVGIAIIIVVILVGGGDDDEGISPAVTAPAPTWAPVPVIDSTEAQLDMIRKAVGVDEVTKGLLDVLPTTVAELQGKADDPTADPVVRAASWVVLEDDYNFENQIVERFALAAVYFATGGDDWTLDQGWLSDNSICDDWYGITCCSHLGEGSSSRCFGKHPDHIAFLDLSDNHLKGTFPVTFALLDELQVLMLGRNQLSGPVDSNIIASMSELTSLHIQFNLFSGPIIDGRALENGVFDTLYIQGNYFDGKWPEAFCDTLGAWNLDCDRNECSNACCFNDSHLQKECTYLSHVISGDAPDGLTADGPFGATDAEDTGIGN